MPEPAVSASHLAKQYATPAEPLVVLRDVSLELQKGEQAAVVGPSGSGKSTLLHILGTLDAPTSGSLRVGGVDPAALKPAKLAHFRGTTVGFVFQDHHLLPQCTAVENVLLARLAVGKVEQAHQARAASLLEQVGLASRAGHFPAELSGGERQRVAIARALMNEPALLLCDEPTGNLDSKSAAAIGSLLHEAAKTSGAVLLVVTHSPELAKTFGRVMRMADGVLEGA